MINKKKGILRPELILLMFNPHNNGNVKHNKRNKIHSTSILIALR